MISSESAWTKKADDEEGMQIDMLILRKDNVVNMCEIKFYSGDFVVSREYYRTLLQRREILEAALSPKTTVHSTLITTFALARNEYSSAFTNVVTLDDLFA